MALEVEWMDGYDTSDSYLWKYPANQIVVGDSSTVYSAVGSGFSSYGRYIDFTSGLLLIQGTGSRGPERSRTWASHVQPRAGSNGYFLGFPNSTGVYEVRVAIDAANKLAIYRGTTLVATAAAALVNNTWYWISVIANIHPSAGLVDVVVYGQPTMSVSFSGNTSQSGGSTCSNAAWGRIGTPTWYADNTIVSGSTGHIPPTRIYFGLPSANTSAPEFVASAGTNNQCVGENPPNTTDYNTGNPTALFSGHKPREAFPISALQSGLPASVLAVQVSAVAEKADVGTVSLGTYADRTGPGVSALMGPRAMSPAPGYQSAVGLMQSDPFTGLPWVTADVYATSWGYGIV